MTDLAKLLNRPPFLPQPTRAEIVGAALAKLHADLAPYRRVKRRATLQALIGAKE